MTNNSDNKNKVNKIIDDLMGLNLSEMINVIQDLQKKLGVDFQNFMNNKSNQTDEKEEKAEESESSAQENCNIKILKFFNRANLIIKMKKHLKLDFNDSKTLINSIPCVIAKDVPKETANIFVESLIKDGDKIAEAVLE